MAKWLFLFLVTTGVGFAQTHPYKDLSHDSKVFGSQKNYRIYLPEGYSQSGRSYPVIYFFHGWGGRHYMDPSAKPEYDLIGELVNKYGVILVMWDGNIEESQPRPYNTGNHNDVKYQIQMKDYFPELVSHIDSNYRTLTDRNHRGIIGFSMGGFMSMFISGKYPDMVSAITDMVGSPEFFIGYPDNHTFYPVSYTFDNLKDVSLRMHNMDNCPLFYMNNEIIKTAELEGRFDFEHWTGKGDHKMDEPGETKTFEMAMKFIINRFNNPVALQKTWSHYDLYSGFDLWGYSVKSNKEEPGYLYLRNVSPSGFGFYSLKWLPDGPSLKNCKATITTAPIYKKGVEYDISLFRKDLNKSFLLKEKAGVDGCLRFELSGDGYEVNISHKSQPADFVVLGHQLDLGKKFIRVNEKNELSITLLNRGGNAFAGKKIQLSITCNDPAVSLSNAKQEIKLDKKDRTCLSLPVGISCSKTPPADASPPWIKLNVTVTCGKDVFFDDIKVPVFFDVPYFSDIEIDDGVMVKNKPIGKGNCNGQAEVSEQIMIYENKHRLRLYTDDPYVETAFEQLFDEVVPGGIWPDGFTLSSIVKIVENCPSGHIIEFLANYETKTHLPIRRDVHWGKVRVRVE